MRLQVESGTAGVFITPVLITTTGAGATTVNMGDCTNAEPPVCTNFIQITEGGVLTGEGSATIEADALTGTIPGAVDLTAGMVDAGDYAAQSIPALSRSATRPAVSTLRSVLA